MDPFKDVSWCLRAATCCLPLSSLQVSLQMVSNSKRAALETQGLICAVCAGCHKACLLASTACRQTPQSRKHPEDPRLHAQAQQQ